MKIMLKGSLWLLVMALTVAFVGATDANADTIKVTYGVYKTGSGGEFTFSDYNTPPISQQAGIVRTAKDTFQSFCIEKNEDLDNGETYDYLVSSKAQLGGIGGGSPDPLSAETAYLFHHFWYGTLGAYDFLDLTNDGDATTIGDGRDGSARELQKAIWALEDELTTAAPTGGQALKWYNEAVAAVASGAWNGLGQVRVLNLYTEGFSGINSKPYVHQSQLVVVPLPGAAALGLGLLGMLGLAGAIRRKRS